jgi:hypothetical protein
MRFDHIYSLLVENAQSDLQWWYVVQVKSDGTKIAPFLKMAPIPRSRAMHETALSLDLPYPGDIEVRENGVYFNRGEEEVYYFGTDPYALIEYIRNRINEEKVSITHEALNYQLNQYIRFHKHYKQKEQEHRHHMIQNIGYNEDGGILDAI